MKLNLKKIEDPKNNKSGTIWEEAYKLLKKNFKKVQRVNTTFNKNLKKDIYFEYFSPDRNIGLKTNMENNNKRAETFVAYKVN